MKKTIALLLLAATVLCGVSCAKKPKTETETPETVRVSVLNGTTGFGMAKLMNDTENQSAALPYDFTVETDATVVRDALVSGSVDIATLPTNLASMVFNKTNGAVKLLAVNTLGVLYVVSSGEVVSFPADFKVGGGLHGATVYCPEQNPTFIFRAICEKAGLTVGTDILLDNTYAQPAALMTATASGVVSLAVLPEPIVTLTQNKAKANGITLHVDCDLNEQWNLLFPEGNLVQGVTVVRTAFAEQYPEAVKTFLNEYESSISFLLDNPAQASEMIAEAGIYANASVAALAIGRCNVTFIKGEEMKPAMQASLQALYNLQPNAFGGKIPDDTFYWIEK